MAIRASIKYCSWDKIVYKQYIPCCDELCVIGQLVLRGTRVETKQQLRSKVWWPGMEKDVEKYCKACHGCQLVSCPDYVEPVRTTSLPSGPWRDLTIDLLGP